jgi:hypothetical protein
MKSQIRCGLERATSPAKRFVVVISAKPNRCHAIHGCSAPVGMHG